MMTRPSTHGPRDRAPTEADLELDAYNEAFEALELEWHWDRATLRDLVGPGSETDRLAAYLRLHRPHLLKVYDADALARAIVEVKDRLRSGSMPHGNH
jgi:hypothetical protein